MQRRIAIYLDSRVPVAKIQLSYLYTKKVYDIANKTAYSKAEIGRKLLMASFETEDVNELKERIFYAANLNQETIKTENISVKRKIADTIKRAVKAAIDKGYLL